MTVQVGDKASRGQKELKTKYPFVSGLVFGTTKQEGRTINLVPTEGSLVPKRKKILLE